MLLLMLLWVLTGRSIDCHQAQISSHSGQHGSARALNLAHPTTASHLRCFFPTQILPRPCVTRMEVEGEGGYQHVMFARTQDSPLSKSNPENSFKLPPEILENYTLSNTFSIKRAGAHAHAHARSVARPYHNLVAPSQSL